MTETLWVGDCLEASNDALILPRQIYDSVDVVAQAWTSTWTWGRGCRCRRPLQSWARVRSRWTRWRTRWRRRPASIPGFGASWSWTRRPRRSRRWCCRWPPEAEFPTERFPRNLWPACHETSSPAPRSRRCCSRWSSKFRPNFWPEEGRSFWRPRWGSTGLRTPALGRSATWGFQEWGRRSWRRGALAVRWPGTPSASWAVRKRLRRWWRTRWPRSRGLTGPRWSSTCRCQGSQPSRSWKWAIVFVILHSRVT